MLESMSRACVPVVALAVSTFGCRSATQITVEVTTDLPCDQVNGSSITVSSVSSLETNPTTAQRVACDGGRLGALVIVPSGDKSQEVAFRVVVGLAGKTPDDCAANGDKGCIVARRALHFVPHSELVVSVAMRGVCKDVPCNTSGQLETCVRGACVRATIPDSSRCAGAGCDEGVLSSGGDAGGGGGPTWTAMASAPIEARAFHTAVWTDRAMIVWGGGTQAQFANDGASYDPAVDRWTKLHDVALSTRRYHSAVWTGREMIVWGGESGQADGARYDPQRDAWTPVELAPIGGRGEHSAVWSTTTSEMIVWGGFLLGAGFQGDGAAYKPSSGTWRVIRASPLSARDGHRAVWDGAKMVVFGGNGCGASTFCGDAASYDPVTDTWSNASPSPVAQSGRAPSVGVAGGAKLAQAFFWGGGNPNAPIAYGDGVVYEALNDRWTSIPSPGTSVVAIAARNDAVGWWGADRLSIWGGRTGDVTPVLLGDGASYDPSSGAWTALPAVGAPSKRAHATAVWTGAAAIVWGGDGKIFHP